MPCVWGYGNPAPAGGSPSPNNCHGTIPSSISTSTLPPGGGPLPHLALTRLRRASILARTFLLLTPSSSVEAAAPLPRASDTLASSWPLMFTSATSPMATVLVVLPLALPLHPHAALTTSAFSCVRAPPCPKGSSSHIRSPSDATSGGHSSPQTAALPGPRCRRPSPET